MTKDNNYFLNKYKKSDSKKNAQHDKSKKTEGNVQKVKFQKIEVNENKKSKLSKKELTAVYSILMGIDNAARVLIHLNEDEIRIIIKEIIKIKEVNKNDIKEVIANFGNLTVDYSLHYTGGEKFAQGLLQKLYGLEKGSKFYLNIIDEDSSGNFFNTLNKMTEKSIVDILSEESEMVISIIFSMMDPKKAADTLSLMSKDKALKVLKRMSQKIEIQPHILDTIVSKLREKVVNVEKEDTIKIHGKNKLVEILKHSSLENASDILNSLEMISPNLAEELKDKLFTFEDIITIPKKSLDFALRDYNDKNIAYLLKGASDKIKTAFFSSITKRRRLFIEDEIKILGKVKKSDVDEKRKEFIEYLKILEAKGKINLSTDTEIYVE